MKKWILSLAIVSISLLNWAQPKMFDGADWAIGETKEINGVNMTRLEGENDANGVTNVGYQTHKQLVEELKERKKQGKVAGDRYKMDLARYNDFCRGGLVQLLITRHTSEECNTKNFHLTVKDKHDKVVYEKEFKDHDPRPNKGGVVAWENHSLAFIREEIFAPLTLEISENQGGEKKLFVFKVELIK